MYVHWRSMSPERDVFEAFTSATEVDSSLDGTALGS